MHAPSLSPQSRGKSIARSIEISKLAKYLLLIWLQIYLQLDHPVLFVPVVFVAQVKDREKKKGKRRRNIMNQSTGYNNKMKLYIILPMPLYRNIGIGVYMCVCVL